MKDVYILDGATGTELIKRGYDGTDQAEWILSHSSAFGELQEAYKEAGSDILYTPTFLCNRAQLALTHTEDKVQEYNERMYALAAKHGTKVFGDLGPTGLFSGRLGKTTEAEIYDIYKEQASVLERCGVDAFIIETMMTKEDALNALRAVKDVSERPVILSLSCDRRGRLLSGTDILEVFAEALAYGPYAFGLNCSTGPDDMLPQIKRIHGFTDLPLLAKPNAGLPVMRGGKTVYDCPPLKFASYAREFIENGVKYLGGCCGTSPEHIKELVRNI
ncbi:MAG: homocysteine S-methyltransferase family protein [Firmicutes bacterium]|nr:homocysteine S-methyltransferase family protein [Bacillota bacterium]